MAPSLAGKCLIAGFAASLGYLAAEATITWAARHGYLVRVPAQVYEELDEPYFRFDPISGYRISSKGFRQARVLPDRSVESVGFNQGNNWGFADSADFHRARDSRGTRRWAIFGDSFSAGLYLRRNWPNAVDSACEGRIECLNLSIDGGGLSNWWSILTRLLAAEEFELDGILFAVAVDDLSRPFTFYFDEYVNGRHSIWGGRSPSLDPASYPNERWQEGMNRISVVAAVAGRRQMDLVAVGVGRSDFVAPRGFYRLEVSPVLWTGLVEMFSGDPLERFLAKKTLPPGMTFDEEQEGLMRAIREVCERNHWPCVVVMLPENFQDPADLDGPRHDVEQFADRLGALLVDGRRPFRGLSIEEYQEFFLNNDIHWNQQGSDRFAGWIAPQLELLAAPSSAPSSFRLVARNGMPPGVVTTNVVDSGPLRNEEHQIELIGSTPSSPDGVMLYQESLRIEEEQTYTVQFRLGAGRERSVGVSLRDDGGRVLGKEFTFRVTAESKYCQFSIRATASAENGRLCFLLGASDLPITIAEVKIWSEGKRALPISPRVDSSDLPRVETSP